MSFLLGLTGSIGMGKSTAAQMFADLGCAVWDADAAVHRAYGLGGVAVEPIRELAPNAVGPDGVVREKLKSNIAQNPGFLKKLEVIVHPLIQKDRADFIRANVGDILVFDIPLLFETSSENTFDAVACVLTSEDVQRRRVLARPGMTADHFNLILSKQIPAADKARRSDYIIPTDTMDTAMSAVKNIVTSIKEQLFHA